MREKPACDKCLLCLATSRKQDIKTKSAKAFCGTDERCFSITSALCLCHHLHQCPPYCCGGKNPASQQSTAKTNLKQYQYSRFEPLIMVGLGKIIHPFTSIQWHLLRLYHVTRPVFCVGAPQFNIGVRKYELSLKSLQNQVKSAILSLLLSLNMKWWKSSFSCQFWTIKNFIKIF